MLQGKCSVYREEVLSDIEPLVFGNFIEFTHDCINQGMWAEMLLNRGFEDRQEEEGVGKHWRETGYNDTGRYSVVEETAFGHGFSQNIENIHHFGGYRGIGQKGLMLREGSSYRFSVWAKGKGISGIAVKLTGDAGELLGEWEISISEEWKCYQILQIKGKKAQNACLEILLQEEGSVWLDQSSLMPEDAVGGIWPEVFQAIKELQPTVLRFPGGCFADCYCWKDGIGSRDGRPAKWNRHWGGMEENNFGTDEFIELCRNLGCEPMICINFGSGDEKEAAQWVEYCNGDATTPMGRLRAENGHPEPYQVKFWGIGNETWAHWEIGNMTAEQCGENYLCFADAMRKASTMPLSLIVCGGDGNGESQEWNREVLKRTGKEAEYIDLHFYAPQLYEAPADELQIYNATVYAAHKYEKIIRDTKAVIRESGAQTRIMVGEYNAMYYNNSNREHTLETALLNGGFLNMFLRNSDVVRIGIFSDLVNGWQGGCIRSSQGAAYGTPSYYVLQLYAQAGLRYSVRTETDCDTVTVAKTGHVPDMAGLPVVDSAAALDGQGRICLFLINRHMTEQVTVEIGGGDYQIAEITALEGAHAYSRNTFGERAVSPLPKEVEKESSVVLAPHSVSRIRLKVKG